MGCNMVACCVEELCVVSRLHVSKSVMYQEVRLGSLTEISRPEMLFGVKVVELLHRIQDNSLPKVV